MLSSGSGQDKTKEIAVFTDYANAGGFAAFTAAASGRLVDRLCALSGLRPGAVVADLGCGSGAFTALLAQRGLRTFGLDLCHPLTVIGRRQHAGVPFVVGDVEQLPLPTGMLDGVLLSGLIHHLPDPVPLAREAFRVLKPGGAFMAFDPNRRNPFMRLYRDPASPLYSARGVSPNERPVLAEEISRVFESAGFFVQVDYLCPTYASIASPFLRFALPLYNTAETLLFASGPGARYRGLLLTVGIKPGVPSAQQQTEEALAHAA